MKLNEFCKSQKGSLLLLVFLLEIIVIMNLLILYFFHFNFGEKHLDLINILSEIDIVTCLTCVFVLDFTVLFVAGRFIEVYEFSYNVVLALINFILVGVTVSLLVSQLYNVEKISVEDKYGEKYNLLVGKIPHYEVIPNPLEDKRDIILEQKDTYDVLENLDDGSKEDKTLPSEQKKFVKSTSIGNKKILYQIISLISFTAPRLLMPILVKQRKETLD